jgi:ABC-type molybdenum transport system ATPase subunit/photorepair protein PhrA
MGANGAGKSTFVNILAGAPSSVLFQGAPPMLVSRRARSSGAGWWSNTTTPSASNWARRMTKRRGLPA